MHGSVVGVNNYVNYNGYNNGYNGFYGFGGFDFGFGFGGPGFSPRDPHQGRGGTQMEVPKDWQSPGP